jgi:hypothetical protein
LYCLNAVQLCQELLKQKNKFALGGEDAAEEITPNGVWFRVSLSELNYSTYIRRITYLKRKIKTKRGSPWDCPAEPENVNR